jgi:hypothetical protein
MSRRSPQLVAMVVVVAAAVALASPVAAWATAMKPYLKPFDGYAFGCKDKKTERALWELYLTSLYTCRDSAGERERLLTQNFYACEKAAEAIISWVTSTGEGVTRGECHEFHSGQQVWIDNAHSTSAVGKDKTILIPVRRPSEHVWWWVPMLKVP